MDGLRSSLSLKGSAGMKPCLFCLNCVKKDAGLNPNQYFEISEHQFSKFRTASDSDIWEIADRLQRYVREGASKSTVEKFEKAAGLVYFPDGMFFQEGLRGRCPPSNICIDGMHAYFSNGCASWEIALCLDEIQKQTRWSLALLCQAALQSEWTGRKCSKHVYTSYIKALFSEKNFSSTLYKGQASQTESLVPLLHYYLLESNIWSPEVQLNLHSFKLLAACCSELRKLRYQWAPISSEDVIRLCDLQQLHQQAFVACYSAEAIKPKHHHRMHLGKAFVSMGVALRCEQHESKHRNYKHGLAERMKSTVHEGFQKSILPRLLLGQAKRMQSIGVDPVRIIGPISQASLFLRELAGDHTLQCCKRVSYFQNTVSLKDLLIFGDGTAGLVEEILNGQVQVMFLLRKMQKQSEKDWGQVWLLQEEKILIPMLSQSWTLPAWWRWSGNTATCLL